MKPQLNMDKIAKRLGGERRQAVRASSGYFGAMQLLAEFEDRLQVPARGGRPTDPSWTERRLLPLAPETLKRLEELSEKLRVERGISIEPMQLAALLLESAAQHVSTDEAKKLVARPKAAASGGRKTGRR